MSNVITKIDSTSFYVPGPNTDTDVIIPARFLKCVVFEGIEENAFADQRQAFRDEGRTHPFDDPQNRAAAVLVVDTNFGCGSSREHAVQCIMRSGIEVIVSCWEGDHSPGFADIFRGNCASNGIPCVDLQKDDHSLLLETLREHPKAQLVVDLEKQTLTIGESRVVGFQMDEGHRKMLLNGSWDTISTLLEAGDQIEEVEVSLPYG